MSPLTWRGLSFIMQSLLLVGEGREEGLVYVTNETGPSLIMEPSPYWGCLQSEGLVYMAVGTGPSLLIRRTNPLFVCFGDFSDLGGFARAAGGGSCVRIR